MESLSLFLRSFSAICVLLHHLTWQCNNKGQGRTESLHRSSKLLRISSKFHAKKQTHFHLTPPNPQSDALRSNFASGSHNSIEKINYGSKIGAIYPCNIYTLLKTCIAFTSFISSKFQTIFPIQTLILRLGNLCFYYSRINGADFWTVVDLFDRVMRSRRKVYQNGLQEGDLFAVNTVHYQ